MGLFGAAHGWMEGWRGGGGGGQKGPVTHILQMMKLGTVIPYLKKILKIYAPRDTFLEYLC